MGRNSQLIALIAAVLTISACNVKILGGNLFVGRRNPQEQSASGSSSCSDSDYPPKSINDSLKIWGAGWHGVSKTGTSALTAAAQEAGSALVDAGSPELQIDGFDDSFAFDIVVPYFLTSPNTAGRVLSLQTYIQPKIRRIYFMVESSVSCPYLKSLGSNIYCFPMHALSGLGGLDIEGTYPQLKAAGRPGGWFVQQFAKLFVSLPDIGLSEYFAIVDSDNLFLKPFVMLEKVRAHTTIEAPTSEFFRLVVQTPEGKVVPSHVTKKYMSNVTVVRARFFAGGVCLIGWSSPRIALVK